MTAPQSTYRLQLGPGFTFADAAEQVDYLSRLGVDAVYLSPVLEATTGSTHGYDVTDPTRARGELGGEDGRRALTTRAREQGLGVVVDIVPNHMSIEVPAQNAWWWDVLMHGRDADHAHYFDVDWSRERILLPVLGSPEDLDVLTVDGDQLAYYDHRFPIAPGTAGGTPQEVHDRQHYELVDWRRGNAELGYRRFFDITTLAGVRVELPDVFDATHAEVLRWVADGDVTGLRVDHPDGLAAPTAYVRRLRLAAPDAWIVVEKILHPGESLPDDWTVDGTTGYDALREVCGVFVDPAGSGMLDVLARQLGVPTDFAEVEQAARRLVTDTVLVAEVRRIAALLPLGDAAAGREAVAELMIAYPVYRSYPGDDRGWDEAVAAVRTRRPDLVDAVAAIERVRAEEPDGELVVRFEQTSGMVVAKGTEDTAFYRYTRFAALNEVGGSPDVFATSVDELHRLAAAREADEPTSMTTLTTHDTKRSEDTRARMIALSEIATDWSVDVRSWSARAGLGEPSLDLLAWQTLVGAWPISDDRLVDYLLKAAREAKLRTTWTEPDEAFEDSIRAWPQRLRDTGVWADVEQVVERVRDAGWSNALGQKLLQLTAPGVPDVYQGTELWDLSLVDPDNRRPVDYAARRAALEAIGSGELPPVDASGAAKLLLVHRALTLRRDRPDLFDDYTPLRASGPASDHVVAFRRSAGLVTVATRLPIGLQASGGWRSTTITLGDGRWTDHLSGVVHDGPDVRVGDLLAAYPVALLTR